NGKKVGREC
ncbi:hypothetical protein HKBW3S06_01237, partial [Candidatus Hakubella thermalkaliphila]